MIIVNIFSFVLQSLVVPVTFEKNAVLIIGVPCFDNFRNFPFPNEPNYKLFALNYLQPLISKIFARLKKPMIT